VTAQRFFPGDEARQLLTAGFAPEVAGGDDAYKEGTVINAVIDSVFPVVAPPDVLRILKDIEHFTGLCVDFAAQAHAELA